VQGGIPAVLIYEDLENLTPYMHTSNDIVGLSLNSPEELEGNARLGAAAVAVLAGPLQAVQSAEFLRGDGNGDGNLDISDAVFILRYLFTSGVTLGCLDAADSGDDGKLDISDAVAVLLELFRESGHIAPPVGSCAPDSTPDGLSCAGYRFCP
jgi:hypothetical protein